MNQIEIITGLPNWRFKEQCQTEIMLNGDELVDQSDMIFRVGNVAVCGLIYSSYVNPPWIWFVFAEDIAFTDLIDFRRVARLIPKGSLTAVKADFDVGLRFAGFYGFKPTGEEQDYFGKRYLIMRKV